MADIAASKLTIENVALSKDYHLIIWNIWINLREEINRKDSLRRSKWVPKAIIKKMQNLDECWTRNDFFIWFDTKHLIIKRCWKEWQQERYKFKQLYWRWNLINYNKFKLKLQFMNDQIFILLFIYSKDGSFHHLTLCLYLLYHIQLIIFVALFFLFKNKMNNFFRIVVFGCPSIVSL